MAEGWTGTGAAAGMRGFEAAFRRPTTTSAGSMAATCARAVELGLRRVAFTEHAEFSAWVIAAGEQLEPGWLPLVRDGPLEPPHLDLVGYTACLIECRERFPALRILSGVELGEPHRHQDQSAQLMADSTILFDRVLGSVHSLPVDGSRSPTSSGSVRGWCCASTWQRPWR